MLGGCNSDKASTVGASRPPLSLTPAEISGAYQANEVAATDRFRDRELEVAGRVFKITSGQRDSGGTVHLESKSFIAVPAVIDSADRALVARIEVGQQIVVRCGFVAAVDQMPVLSECRLDLAKPVTSSS